MGGKSNPPGNLSGDPVAAKHCWLQPGQDQVEVDDPDGSGQDRSDHDSSSRRLFDGDSRQRPVEDAAEDHAGSDVEAAAECQIMPSSMT